MKRILSSLIIFIICFSLLGCSCSKDKNIIIYRNFYSHDVSTFNYLMTNDYNEVTRIANLVDGLVEHDKYGNLIPSIAKSWKSEIINNKQVWTFYLKDNVYWSDYTGNKHSLVTAYDFVTSLKYILNYNTHSNNYSIPISLIDNASNYYNATLIENYNYNDVVNKINELNVSDENNELNFYLNIKSIFDTCNKDNNCINNFDIVGVKAISDFTLQYTLTTPSPYFLSVLTNYMFLPANEDFIKEVGFNNFGTNKQTLLYNGAYILENYYHSSRFEYIKNKNYWDKDNVFIDKLIFTKALNYHSASYARLSYESGNISEFTLSKADNDGWKKYVTGSDNSGSIESPIGNNTYVSNDTTNFVSYYLVFNQNRVNYSYTSLTNSELDVANQALKNNNFRKALTYGLRRDSSFINEYSTELSSIIPDGFSYYNNSHYHNYYIQEYASNNGLSYDDAVLQINNDPFYNQQLSNHYLQTAIEELNLSSEQLPIKIEYTYYYDDKQMEYDKILLKQWNKILNGCADTEENCSFDKVEIVFNEAVASVNTFNIAFANQEYNIGIVGLYPDFDDPTAYLNYFKTEGELFPFLNHNSLLIDEKINEINKHYSTDDLNTRYLLCSDLEYLILYEENLLLPLTLKDTAAKIVVSDLVPYEKMKASYGLSPFKFKYRKMATIEYSQIDIAKLKEEYEKGRNKHD